MTELYSKDIGWWQNSWYCVLWKSSVIQLFAKKFIFVFFVLLRNCQNLFNHNRFVKPLMKLKNCAVISFNTPSIILKMFTNIFKKSQATKFDQMSTIRFESISFIIDQELIKASYKSLINWWFIERTKLYNCLDMSGNKGPNQIIFRLYFNYKNFQNFNELN